MEALTHLWRRLRAWLGSSRLSRETDEEMAFHLAMEAEKHAGQGLAPDQAAQRARRSFGSTLAAREDVREAHGLAWWDALVADLRIAFRALAREPGFHALLIGTLALGIGLAATIMAAVDAVLLRPVPYVDADRTVEVWAVGEDGTSTHHLTQDGWHAVEATVAPFEALAAYDLRGLEYSGTDDATILQAAYVSESFFRVLPVPAWRGRTLEPSDFGAGGPVVVVSHDFWRRRMGSVADPVGKTVLLDGRTVTVVGVLPPDFGYPTRRVELWVPMPREASDRFVVWVLGRIRGDFESAARLADQLAKTVGREHPDLGLDHGLRLERFDANRVNRDTELALELMAGAVLAVLLVSAANAMNLLLFRGVGRQREFSMRLALGSGRRRLVRQLLVETLVVVGIAGVAALGLARVGTVALRGLLPPDFTWQAHHDVTLSARVIVGALVGSLILALTVGLLPALRASRAETELFRSGGLGTAGATNQRSGVRQGLVALELAFSALLLLVGGLFTRSFVALNRVDLGIQMAHLAVLDLQLSRTRYPDSTSRADLMRRVEERLRRIPGVADLSLTDGMAPHTGIQFRAKVAVEGQEAPAGEPGVIFRSAVDPSYFGVVGTPIVRGRAFDRSDAEVGSEHRVIISEAFASWLFRGTDPIGRRIRLSDEEGWLTVVGIAADARLGGPDDREGQFALYWPVGRSTLGSFRSIVIRTQRNPAELLVPIHQAVRALDPLQPIVGLQTAQVRFDERTRGPRFLTWLMAGFATVGLGLGLVGLYGVLSYSVSQRAREIGIRMAVGASAPRIVAMVLRQASLMVAIGIGFGLALAAVLSPRLAPLLYGIEPHDIVIFAGVPVLLVVVAGLAGVVPSRRASRVEPMSVLRVE